MNTGIYDGLILGWALLLGSAVAAPLLAGRRKAAGWLNFTLCLLAGGLFTRAGMLALFGGAVPAARIVQVGSHAVPLLVDGVSGLFLALISLMAAAAAFHSIGYMEHYADYGLRGYYLNFPLFVAGMIGIVTVDDLSLGFTVAWQVMTLASFFLIRFDSRNPANVKGANKYLVLMELAWVAILAGAFAIPGALAGDPLHALAAKLAGAEVARVAAVCALLLAGFGLKAGVFPLGQLWLPDAHSVAPSPISALLSGVMIKTGIYGILRTLFFLLPVSAALPVTGRIGLIVAGFGAVTLFMGTVQAIKQDDAKRLHAYSSIGQMGYILLALGSAHAFIAGGIPALRVLAALALVGALYHTVNHAFFKGLLFLVTGSVQYATGTKDLNRLGGLMRLMPMTALAAAIASASMAGLPACSAYMSKWALISADLLAGRDAGVFVLFGIVALMTNAVTLALYVKFFGMTFTSVGIEWNAGGERPHGAPKGRASSSGDRPPEVREVGTTMLLPQALLATLCLIQGLCPALSFALITKAFAVSEGSPLLALFNDPALPGALSRSGLGIAVTLPGAPAAAAVAMPVVLALLFLFAYALANWFAGLGGGAARTAPAWLCGYQDLGDSTRYRSRNMYAPFKKFMQWTGGNV